VVFNNATREFRKDREAMLESIRWALITSFSMDIPYHRGFEHLFQSLSSHLKPDELGRVQSAYELARVSHAGQMRDEGTPYILHPIRVASVLSDELGLYSSELACAALLHDVIEDTGVTREQIRLEFGDRVAQIVWLLTKLPEVSLPGYLAAIEEASDLKAPVVKLCDRLDNIRFLMRSPKAEKKRRYIKTTEQYYLPLAARTDKYLYDQLQDAIELARTLVHARYP
jgi:(p)ppGpp synthase/HD superfamily hydrolase